MRRKLYEEIQVDGAEYIDSRDGYDLFKINTWAAAQEFSDHGQQVGTRHCQNEDTFNNNLGPGHNAILYVFARDNTNEVDLTILFNPGSNNTITLANGRQIHAAFAIEDQNTNANVNGINFPFDLIPNGHIDHPEYLGADPEHVQPEPEDIEEEPAEEPIEEPASVVVQPDPESPVDPALKYKIVKSAVHITGYGKYNPTDIDIQNFVSRGCRITIPLRIEGYPVTVIDDYAFANMDSRYRHQVRFEVMRNPQTNRHNIKHIGNYAFANDGYFTMQGFKYMSPDDVDSWPTVFRSCFKQPDGDRQPTCATNVLARLST